jgi:hypothetical protein
VRRGYWCGACAGAVRVLVRVWVLVLLGASAVGCECWCVRVLLGASAAVDGHCSSGNGSGARCGFVGAGDACAGVLSCWWCACW